MDFFKTSKGKIAIPLLLLPVWFLIYHYLQPFTDWLVFGIHRLSLMGELFEDGVWKRFVFVEDDDNSLNIFTDGNLSIAQSIVWTIRLDLVDDLVELDGQVLGKQSGILTG